MKKRCLMFWMLGGVLSLVLAGGAAWAEDRITVKDVASQDVVSVRKTVAMDRIGESMGKMYQELYSFLKDKNTVPAGPPLALYHSPPGKDIDVEACVPVPAKVEGGGAVVFQTLSGGKMASLMSVGPYEKIEPAYQELFHWITENGYEMAGPSREVYLKGPPENKPEDYRTEILWPVKKK